MTSLDWFQIAQKCGPLIGSTRRGVLQISSFGFYAIFVPNLERERVERDLAHAYFPIHGIALHTMEEGERIFVAVVKADSVEKLRAIAHGKTDGALVE